MTTSDPQLITSKAAAEILGVSVVTLRAWRNAAPQVGPRWIQYGRRVKYDRSEVERWKREGDCYAPSDLEINAERSMR